MDHTCNTCHYYAPAPANRRPNLGICTHPEHATSGVLVLINKQETRCRRGWGVDDWTPAGADRDADPADGPPSDRVIDERPSPWTRPRRVAPLFAPIPLYLDLGDAVAD